MGLDKIKQTNSFSANVVHSLDATHIILFCAQWFNDQEIHRPISFVHDCYGTTLNYVGDMNILLRKAFIELYESKNEKPIYLIQFHQRQIQNLKDAGFEVNDDNTHFVLPLSNGVKNIIIPPVPKLGKLDIQEITDALYKIY